MSQSLRFDQGAHRPLNDALTKAHELGRQPGHFCPRQFESEWDVEENRLVLGPEILAQLPAGRLPDALVAGVGTGGTLIGVGQALRAVNPAVRLFAMEPSESCTLVLRRGRKIPAGALHARRQRHRQCRALCLSPAVRAGVVHVDARCVETARGCRVVAPAAAGASSADAPNRMRCFRTTPQRAASRRKNPT
ncbi:MAG: pyridoxal-phosphate dependent enzyme [Rhodanobacter sp.]